MEKKVTKLLVSDTEDSEIKYWQRIPPEEKLSLVQELREQYIKLYNKEEEYARSRERLRRVYRIIKQK